MEIRGTTQIYGLIGNPVAHSVSPQLQNLFAEDAGLDMAYVTFPVADRDSVGRAVEGAFALGIGGLNVTVPYKGESTRLSARKAGTKDTTRTAAASWEH